MHQLTEHSISTRLTREYGIRHPFVGAGMGFVAHEQLAAAVTNAGGLGFLGASPDPPPSLIVMVERLRQLTDGPFGVDLICAQLPQGRATTDEHVETCVELGVNVVAQGAEAGGHSRSTVPALELLAQMRERFPDLLVLAGGGIGDGRRVAEALQAGADGVWVGTSLIASEEAYAHHEYKRRLVEASGETIVTTAFGPEWPNERYRVLPTRTVSEWAGREHEIPTPPPGPAVIGHTRLFPHSANVPYEMPKFSCLPPTRDTSGDWDEMTFPAGQAVGLIHEIKPAAEIVEEMMAEARSLLEPHAMGGIRSAARA